MDLQLPSGQVISSATEEDLHSCLLGEQYVILGADDTYLQCARLPWSEADQYRLEYQAGSLAEHYWAANEPIPFDRAFAALTSYLRGESGWHFAFRWGKMDLS
jgi:hypothetical protein